MRSVRPRSLAGRLGVLLVLAVVAAQLAALLVFLGERSVTERVTLKTQMMDRMQTLVELARKVPPAALPDVVATFSTPRHRFSLDAESAISTSAMGGAEADLANRFAQRRDPSHGEVRLTLAADPEQNGAPFPFGSREVLRMSVRIADARWINGEMRLPSATPPWIRMMLLQLVTSVVAALLVAALARNWLVRPAAALAAAAEQFGRGAPHPPLPERGPREFRTMTRAFNLMQGRLRAFVDDRTRMLAAISHDLRTPIASLRLRAEMVDDDDLRDAMVRTLADMRATVEATLAFARDEGMVHDGELFDLAALVGTVVEEQRALGRDVTCSVATSQTFHGRSMILRRAVTNVVENAVRYGARARLSIGCGADALSITVDDDRPGVPDDKVEEVFAPFARLEGSRNADTGGVGLGLAFARSAARAHGGDVRIRNRTGGGLRCEILLPLGR